MQMHNHHVWSDCESNHVIPINKILTYVILRKVQGLNSNITQVVKAYIS